MAKNPPPTWNLSAEIWETPLKNSYLCKVALMGTG